jgi:hypothetical protein
LLSAHTICCPLPRRSATRRKEKLDFSVRDCAEAGPRPACVGVCCISLIPLLRAVLSCCQVLVGAASIAAAAGVYPCPSLSVLPFLLLPGQAHKPPQRNKLRQAGAGFACSLIPSQAYTGSHQQITKSYQRMVHTRHSHAIDCADVRVQNNQLDNSTHRLVSSTDTTLNQSVCVPASQD